MARIEILEWDEFFQGKVIPKNPPASGKLVKVASKTHLAITALTPHTPAGLSFSSQQIVPMAANSSFLTTMTAVLNMADWLCIGVIIFSGASWMFGNRTKAIEHFMGGAIGYIIIRKAHIIQQFLKGL